MHFMKHMALDVTSVVVAKFLSPASILNLESLISGQKTGLSTAGQGKRRLIVRYPPLLFLRRFKYFILFQLLYSSPLSPGVFFFVFFSKFHLHSTFKRSFGARSNHWHLRVGVFGENHQDLKDFTFDQLRAKKRHKYVKTCMWTS